ncbi:MAG: alginate export family protein [Candidatus Omnitrophica bacterium]|jgi:hypothetical protein|nr:alginate export family protein [Candidatus Omnitrophota bacterium]
MRLRKSIFVFLALVFICSQASFAEVKGKWGWALRLRHEYWKNIFDMNGDALDNRNFFRVKESLWGQADFSKDMLLYAKITNEFKPYVYYAPSSAKSSGKSDKSFHFDINEFIFDNLYFGMKNVAKLPVDLTIGRQDLTGYGENFIFADGTPQDGSRTFYFNAAKATWRLDDKSSLDFIYINDPRDDIYLPVINEDKAPQNLNTTDETAGAIYYRTKAIKDVLLESYYVYKREAADSGVGFQSQKGGINTIGAYAKYNFSPFTLRAQLAQQFGTYGANDRQATGGYVFLDRDIKMAWSPQATIGFAYLSGDKTGSSKLEAWDPLFSRFPWMSELFYMTYKTETGINAYWTNLELHRAGLIAKPMKKMKLSVFYNFLRAPQQVAASSFCSGESKQRGHLPQARVDYAFTDNISAYFLAEYFMPGKFYKEKDDALFLRTELMFKF